MFHILIVCTANICRSPASRVFMARALLGKSAHVDSAGTLAIDGHFADPQVQKLMVLRQFPEIRDHRSHGLMSSHINKSDLILCMERNHIYTIEKISPTAVGKCMLLGHWSGMKELQDPSGGEEIDYITALDEINKYCSQWVTKLIDMGLVE